MKNPGILIKLADGRRCIVYDRQPFLKQTGKIALHLVDEKGNLILKEDGKPKMLIKDVFIYNEEEKTLIGYVD